MKGKFTGGRVKGVSRNKPKPSDPILAHVHDATDEYYRSGRFKQDIDKLDPKDRVSAMEKHLQYFASKKTDNEHHIGIDTTGAVETLEQHLSSLANQYDKH